MIHSDLCSREGFGRPRRADKGFGGVVVQFDAPLDSKTLKDVFDAYLEMGVLSQQGNTV